MRSHVPAIELNIHDLDKEQDEKEGKPISCKAWFGSSLDLAWHEKKMQGFTQGIGLRVGGEVQGVLVYKGLFSVFNSVMGSNLFSNTPNRLGPRFKSHRTQFFLQKKTV